MDGPLEVPYSDGGRAWFQAFEDDMRLIAPAPGETRRLRSLAAAADAVCAALHALVRDGGWRYDALQLFGFSDGGTVRCGVGARAPRVSPRPPLFTPRRLHAVPPRARWGATATRTRAVVPATLPGRHP